MSTNDLSINTLHTLPQAGPSRPTLRRNPSSSLSTTSNSSDPFTPASYNRNLSPVDAPRKSSFPPSPSPRHTPLHPTSGSSSSRKVNTNLSQITRRILRAMTSILPPHIRRIFTSPRLSAIVLGLVVVLGLYTFSGVVGEKASSLGLLPDSWREGVGYGYPPDTHATLPSDDATTKPVPDTPALNLPTLPSAYSPHFPDLQLPSTLLTNPSFHPLARRLHDFLLKPIYSHEDGMAINEAQCPRGSNGNEEMEGGEHEYWGRVNVADVAERRGQVVRWMGEWAGKGDGDGGLRAFGKGKGIVLTGGNQDTTSRLISVLKHLKRLGTELPIEVFHYPDELHDGNERKEIESLGAVLREVQGVGKVEGVWKNWQIKGLAIVQSSFREILYLDSDNTPLRDPTHLFTSPIYLSHGSAFWPDLWKDHPHNAIWRLIGEPCTYDHWTFESGQLLIDKSGNDGLNMAALVIAAEMQGDRDFWFHMCSGDKDTFRWGWRVLGLEWGGVGRWMSTVGFRNAWDGGRFCGHTVLQYDLVIPEGQTRELPLFVHSNLLKHLGGQGLGRGNLFTHVKRMHNDSITNPQLDHVHQWVYDGTARGMCIDVEWRGSASKELSAKEMEDNYIEEIPVGELEGGVFEGFEDAFFDEGGRIGGW